MVGTDVAAAYVFGKFSYQEKRDNGMPTLESFGISFTMMQLSSTNIAHLAHAHPRCKICGNLIMCYWRAERSLHSLGIWVVAVCE